MEKKLAIKIVSRDNPERRLTYYYVDANTGERLTAADLPGYRVLRAGTEKPWLPSDGDEGEADEETGEPVTSGTGTFTSGRQGGGEGPSSPGGYPSSLEGQWSGSATFNGETYVDASGKAIDLSGLGYIGDTTLEKVLSTAGIAVASAINPIAGIGLGVGLRAHNRAAVMREAAKLGVDLSDLRSGFGLWSKSNLAVAVDRIKQKAAALGVTAFDAVDTVSTQVDAIADAQITPSSIQAAKDRLPVGQVDFDSIAPGLPAGALTNEAFTAQEMANPTRETFSPEFGVGELAGLTQPSPTASFSPTSLEGMLDQSRATAPSAAQSFMDRMTAPASVPSAPANPASLNTFDPTNVNQVQDFTGLSFAPVGPNIGAVTDVNYAGPTRSSAIPNARRAAAQQTVNNIVQDLNTINKSVQTRFNQSISGVNSVVDLTSSKRNTATTQHQLDMGKKAADLDLSNMSGPAKVGTVMAAMDLGYNSFGIGITNSAGAPSSALHIGYTPGKPGVTGWGYVDGSAVNINSVANRTIPGTQTTVAAVMEYANKRNSVGITRDEIMGLSPDFAESVVALEQSLPTPTRAPVSGQFGPMTRTTTGVTMNMAQQAAQPSGTINTVADLNAQLSPSFNPTNLSGYAFNQTAPNVTSRQTFSSAPSSAIDIGIDYATRGFGTPAPSGTVSSRGLPSLDMGAPTPSATAPQPGVGWGRSATWGGPPANPNTAQTAAMENAYGRPGFSGVVSADQLGTQSFGSSYSGKAPGFGPATEIADRNISTTGVPGDSVSAPTRSGTVRGIDISSSSLNTRADASKAVNDSALSAIRSAPNTSRSITVDGQPIDSANLTPDQKQNLNSAMQAYNSRVPESMQVTDAADIGPASVLDQNGIATPVGTSLADTGYSFADAIRDSAITETNQLDQALGPMSAPDTQYSRAGTSINPASATGSVASEIEASVSTPSSYAEIEANIDSITRDFNTRNNTSLSNKDMMDAIDTAINEAYGPNATSIDGEIAASAIANNIGYSGNMDVVKDRFNAFGAYTPDQTKAKATQEIIGGVMAGLTAPMGIDSIASRSLDKGWANTLGTKGYNVTTGNTVMGADLPNEFADFGVSNYGGTLGPVGFGDYGFATAAQLDRDTLNNQTRDTSLSGDLEAAFRDIAGPGWSSALDAGYNMGSFGEFDTTPSSYGSAMQSGIRENSFGFGEFGGIGPTGRSSSSVSADRGGWGTSDGGEFGGTSTGMGARSAEAGGWGTSRGGEFGGSGGGFSGGRSDGSGGATRGGSAGDGLRGGESGGGFSGGGGQTGGNEGATRGGDAGDGSRGGGGSSSGGMSGAESAEAGGWGSDRGGEFG